MKNIEQRLGRALSVTGLVVAVGAGCPIAQENLAGLDANNSNEQRFQIPAIELERRAQRWDLVTTAGLCLFWAGLKLVHKKEG